MKRKLSLSKINYKKFPTRICRVPHHCKICNLPIIKGQQFYDGLFGRRAHVNCVNIYEREDKVKQCDCGDYSDELPCYKCLKKHNARLQEQVDKLITDNKEFCICAAIKTPLGIIRGYRHGDCFRTMYNKNIKRSSEEVQGFITSKNRFVNRQEGYMLQIAANVKSADPDGYITPGVLYSEDLY